MGARGTRNRDDDNRLARSDIPCEPMTLSLPQRLIIALVPGIIPVSAFAFEGTIELAITRGSETTSLRYVVGEDSLRIEVEQDKAFGPINLVERTTGGLILVYPHNRSFVRLSGSKPNDQEITKASTPPGVGPSPQLSSGGRRDLVTTLAAAGLILPSRSNYAPTPPPTAPSSPPVPNPPGISKPSMPQVGAVPGMPPMPVRPVMTEKLELQSTGKKEKILGYLCQSFEIKQRGQILEIWATDQLLPYQPYLNSQPPQFGPRTIEEEWPWLLAARNLFPLRAVLRPDIGPDQPGGPERMRFEVKAITPKMAGKGEKDLFRAPPDYTEIEATHF